MIDFHSHILPGIDDGSRDIDMTRQMLHMEKDVGVSYICATPHFYAHRRSVDSFLERRDRALAGVLELIREDTSLPSVIPGAEVYYFIGMGRAELLTQLCIGDTDTILLELPFDQWQEDILDDVEEMIQKRRLNIVLAHIERYERFQRDRRVWDKLLGMPISFQLNCEAFVEGGSWLRGNRRQNFCLKMLATRENCVLGTDCHNLTDRKPNMGEARSVIAKKAGDDRLRTLDEYAERLLMG